MYFPIDLTLLITVPLHGLDVLTNTLLKCCLLQIRILFEHLQYMKYF